MTNKQPWMIEPWVIGMIIILGLTLTAVLVLMIRHSEGRNKSYVRTSPIEFVAPPADLTEIDKEFWDGHGVKENEIRKALARERIKEFRCVKNQSCYFSFDARDWTGRYYYNGTHVVCRMSQDGGPFTWPAIGAWQEGLYRGRFGQWLEPNETVASMISVRCTGTGMRDYVFMIWPREIGTNEFDRLFQGQDRY